jgi:hypothetical protein
VRSRWPVGVLALAVVVSTAACGAGADGGAESQAAASPARTSTAAAPATTLPPPPGGRRPTQDHPLRVLLAGDSLMADMSLAISSTLQDGGRAVVRLVAAPSVPRIDAYRTLWREQLDEFDPEVIVVLIGVWEGMAEEALTPFELGTPRWERSYRRNALEPYLDLLTSEGAEVVWVGMPPGAEPDRAREFNSLNRAVTHLARESADLTFVPGGRLLSAPHGGWADVLPGPNGHPQRVRRLDTTHLCADGAVRLARPVLRWVRDQYDIPLLHDWPHRNWRWVFPAEECPPV